MSKPWNLNPKEWSAVLQTTKSAQFMAKNILNNNNLPWVETLIKFTRDSETTLDMGSGAGQNSAVLALRGRKTTLFDWSKENIYFSKELFSLLGTNGEFCQADMTKRLPFDDNYFDTVFSCGVFEYFDDKEIKNILREAFRVARKRVIIMVPNALSAAYRFGMWYMRITRKWHWGGERPFGTLKPYFRHATQGNLEEFTVGVKHSLNFLTMPRGKVLQRILIRLFRLKEHSKPAFLRQGYLLICIGEKK